MLMRQALRILILLAALVGGQFGLMGVSSADPYSSPSTDPISDDYSEKLSRPVDQDLLGDHDLLDAGGGAFDELAAAERGAGTDEGDKVGRRDGQDPHQLLQIRPVVVRMPEGHRRCRLAPPRFRSEEHTSEL